MVNMRATQSFSTYVDGDCVSVYEGQVVDLPEDRANALKDGGFLKDMNDKAKDAGPITPVGGNGVSEYFHESPEPKPEVDKAAHTSPKRAAGVVRASLDRDPEDAAGRDVPAEVDEDAHTNPERAAEIVRASLDRDPDALGEHVPAEVDESVVETQADIVQETTREDSDVHAHVRVAEPDPADDIVKPAQEPVSNEKPTQTRRSRTARAPKEPEADK